jgi:hypothetical protein
LAKLRRDESSYVRTGRVDVRVEEVPCDYQEPVCAILTPKRRRVRLRDNGNGCRERRDVLRASFNGHLPQAASDFDECVDKGFPDAGLTDSPVERLRGAALVSMVEPADFRNRDDRSAGRDLPTERRRTRTVRKLERVPPAVELTRDSAPNVAGGAAGVARGRAARCDRLPSRRESRPDGAIGQPAAPAGR